MKAIETFAVFDGEGNLKIENPPGLKNKKVKLLILIEEDEENTFYDLSSARLADAYKIEEPDYTISDLNEPNVDYAGR